MRVLIVEDDATSRNLIERCLAGYGTCDVATDGIHALEVFLKASKEGNPYNLICLDVMMPKLDGLSTLRAIREYERKMNFHEDMRAKIVMTTALNDQQTLAESNEAGCEAFIWKPVNVNRFTAILDGLDLIRTRR